MAVVFALNGLLVASFISRVPDVRSSLGLDNGALGLLLLAMAVGSLAALPLSGRLVSRFGGTAVVRAGAVVAAVGATAAGVGVQVWGSVVAVAVALLLLGAGIGAWDVAMNLEAAEVERRLRRSIMARFHAAFSLGTVGGAGLAVLVTAGDVGPALHLAVVSPLVLAVTWWSAARFLPARASAGSASFNESGSGSAGSAWLEPRTLAIGVMVLAFAVTEGSANDWLTVALIDGHDVEHWVGVAGYALFVTAMTVGRLVGPWALDRWGRPRTLWATTALALVGLLLVVLGQGVVLVGVGVLLWGLGASLGFPVGMSAASDDPARAEARVSVVATIGYAAFLAGPPLLGWLGDAVGTLRALLAVAVLLVPAAVAVLAARPPRAISEQDGPQVTARG
ncbi:MFS transporter [Nocardioides nanhaiensis]|uniref:MFS transporter n=1 Tax=Nocardioides nanhaiensis TaxID=1476871 RepID=A0ABP8X0P9_9ACTN